MVRSSSDPASATAASNEARFAWHPTYRGRTVAEVRAEITAELASDQRAYALALEGAEQQENAALATVLRLEKKWGEYDFGWAESDPNEVSARIIDFEQARDARQDMIPYSAYRSAQTASASPAQPAPRSFSRPAIGGGQGRLLWIAAAVVVALLLILILM